jgi:hypothetical protein
METRKWRQWGVAIFEWEDKEEARQLHGAEGG